MDNIKQLLIEKEREAYLANNSKQALFYASTLDYVIQLEEQVNSKDAAYELKIEQLENKLERAKEVLRG